MTEDPWAYYARLQKRANSHALNDAAWAVDDALSEVLELIAAGQPLPGETELETLIGNRRRKHRARRKLLEKYQGPDGDRPDQAAMNRIDTEAALSRLSQRDRAIVVRLSEGQSYERIAASLSKPVGSVKSWAYRARQKMAA